MSFNLKPLGTQFNSYELNNAINTYTLDPYQYNITRFDYKSDKPNTDGLIYQDVDFDKLLPTYTAASKSVNDFPAQSYHRFMANEGYFNPTETEKNNGDLWYYGATQVGAALNVQEVAHIIFPEAQRGGTNSQNLAKYSWTSNKPKVDTTSWESINYRKINNDSNCEFFSYNTNLPKLSDSVYSFDSNYCRNIGINAPGQGSMPFAN
jgi:hypothetical protein